MTFYLQAEYDLLRRLAPLQSPSSLSKAYAAVTQQMIVVFNSIVSTIQALAKKSVRKYLYLAFSTYSELAALQGRWDDILRQPANRKQNDLAEALYSLRAVCLRIFPEIIADIKIAGNVPLGPSAKPVEVGTNIAAITKNVSLYLPCA